MNHPLRPLLSVLAFSAAFAVAARAQTDRPTAETVLQQMLETYSSTQSYQDVTSAKYQNPDGSAGAVAECSVWFMRPSFFRIDGQSRRAPDAPPKHEVIWSDGESARSWSSTHPVTTRTKIQLAGSKMFGTYAYHVPTLLEASYGGPRRLQELDDPQLAADEKVDGVDCYHVHGSWQGDAYDVLLGKDDHLVRRIVANYKGYIMEELHRDIRLNEPVAKSVFEFAPEEIGAPAQKATPPPPLPGEHRRP